MSIDLMTVTNNGLININKRVVDFRNFSDNLITTVGDVNVVNSVVSNFGETSYLQKVGISYTEGTKSITINFNGLIVPSTKTQVAWELRAPNSTISLSIVNNIITLISNGEEILSLPDSPISVNTQVLIRTTLEKNYVELFLLVGDEPDKESVELSLRPLSIEGTKDLYIGGIPEEPQNFWLGSVDLQKFSILEDTHLLYSPSDSSTFSITKIVLSDGTIRMPDTPQSFVNHMYALDVTEISRTGDSFLVTSEIGADEKLIIREVGIYGYDGKNSFLYSSIENLNINKGANVSYELVLSLSITTSFVNIIGFPDIVLKMPDLAPLKYFTIAKDTVPGVMTGLERCVSSNAYKIGFNRDQVFYRLQQSIAEKEECYSAIQTYDKLMKRFQRVPEFQLNPNGITVTGDVGISSNFEASDFSTNNYLQFYANLDTSKDWTWTTGFKTGSDIQTAQSLISSSIPGDTKQPFYLSIKNDKCHLSMATQEEVSVEFPSSTAAYFRNPNEDFKSEQEVIYYGYSLKESANGLYNFHTSYPVGVRSSSVLVTSTLPEEATWTPNAKVNTSSWTLEVAINRGVLSGTENVYIVGGSSPIKIFLNPNGNLNAELEVSDGESVTLTSGDSNLGAHNYLITLSYDGSQYSLGYELLDDPKPGETLPTSETFISEDTSKLISLDENNALTFGSDNGNNKFQGSIDFSKCSFVSENVLDMTNPGEDISWVGASLLDSIFTTSSQINSESLLYDDKEYLVKNIDGEDIKPSTVKNTSIFEGDLFAIEPNTEYILQIKYSGGSYSFSSSVNDRPLQEITTEVAPLEKPLAPLESVYLGVLPVFSNSLEPTLQDPFLGSLLLKNYLLSSDGTSWQAVNEFLSGNNQLVQDFYAQKFNKSIYKLLDIYDPSCSILFYDNTFKSIKDNIDFNSKEGFTLSTKVTLENSEPKLLLAKSNLNNALDFALYFVNNRLVFVLTSTYLNSSGISVKEDIRLIRELQPNEIHSYISSPILVTITLENYNGNYALSMYKNNEMVASTQGYVSYFGSTDPDKPSSTVLSNYLPDNLLRRVLLGESNAKYSLDELVALIQNDTLNRVSNIIGMTGVISSKDLYYVTNLTDTNF